MIIAIGIIAAICVFVLVYMCAHYTATLKGHKMGIAALLTMVCGILPMMLIIIGVLSLSERDRNMYKDGYNKGVTQKFTYKIDTVWEPKK